MVSGFNLSQRIYAGALNPSEATHSTPRSQPVLQSELSKPHRRGKLVIAETCITVFGIALANWVDYGLIYGMPGPNAWRVGLALQGAFPMVVFVLIGSVPESPR